MIACPDCGLLAEIPRLGPRTSALCRLCNAPLERTTGRDNTSALCCALGVLLLLFPANLLLFLNVSMFGMHNHSRLGSGAALLWDHDWILLAALIGVCAVVLPFLRFGLLSAVLGALRLGYHPTWLGTAFRWSLWLDVWAMPDVFLLSCLVGYFRLVNISQMSVLVDAGGWCFLAAASMSMVTRAALDHQAVWRAIAPDADLIAGRETLSCTCCNLVRPAASESEACSRCGARLHARKPKALERATALTVAALICFVPANLLSMNTTVQLGKMVDYTIFKGVRELFKAGLWPLGVIILCTSIGIPALKIAGLGWCILSVRRRSKKHLIAKTKLYRLIRQIGRWSNVDPLTIAVFVPLMRFKPFAYSDAGWGALAFIAVVVLTLLAAMCFDARLMWDAAEGTQRE